MDPILQPSIIFNAFKLVNYNRSAVHVYKSTVIQSALEACPLFMFKQSVSTAANSLPNEKGVGEYEQRGALSGSYFVGKGDL
ncbi:hypothetical protein Tcan_05388 [Toxocara canis]|uniref:Uncharacterized protein n=1 Tax=Toxocara canis TaxID=6265 RepID=A0A0B2VPU2_TOXCA|nr:hypothetical protein Tcan_05388 [Toxocara canis]